MSDSSLEGKEATKLGTLSIYKFAVQILDL